MFLVETAVQPRVSWRDVEQEKTDNLIKLNEIKLNKTSELKWNFITMNKKYIKFNEINLKFMK